MPETVIDRLEAVQIEATNGRQRLLCGNRRESLALQRQSVAQAR